MRFSLPGPSLCLTHDGAAPHLSGLCADITPKSFQTPTPSSPLSPDPSSPVESLGADWCQPRADGEGTSFLEEKPLRHSASLLTGQLGRVQVTTKSQSLGLPPAMGAPGPASLPPSLPVKPGTWEPVRGKGLVPSRCPGTTSPCPTEKGQEQGRAACPMLGPGTQPEVWDRGG